MYFVYILKSLKKKRYYIGYCSDLKKRLIQHNSGGTLSTKPYIPWICIYSENYELKSDATKREWHLKHPKGFLEKKAIIKQYGEHGGVTTQRVPFGVAVKVK